MPPLERLRHAKDFLSAWHAPLTRYERHISAVAMIAGFAVDNYTFGRIDRPGANLIFTGYLVLAAGAIAMLHWLQARADRKAAAAVMAMEKSGRTLSPGIDARRHATLAVATTFENAAAAADREMPAGSPRDSMTLGKRLHGALPAATQFALGGLWSGFLVFYSRSAVFAASWPFLVLLGCILIGNEVFRRYRDRLVFAGLLFFFALYSYAIFVVPILLGHIGSLVFAVSGLAAILLFVFFLRLLQRLGPERFRQTRYRLFGGAFAILAVMNLFYFTDVLPPLPLALSNVGVYHAVKRTGAIYTAAAEPQSFTTRFNLSHAVLHVAPGESLSVYSAVFAPIRLTTKISHRWQWYDPARKRWVLQSMVTFPISGGREGGYRGYTIKSKPKPGDWRVDIDTEDGRLIGRVAFDVQSVPTPVATQQTTIQ